MAHILSAFFVSLGISMHVLLMSSVGVYNFKYVFYVFNYVFMSQKNVIWGGGGAFYN